MVTVYLCRGINRLDDVEVQAGTAVEIVTPSGCWWRPRPDGSIEVLPRWWRRAIDWILDRNVLHVVAAIFFVAGIIITFWGR